MDAPILLPRCKVRRRRWGVKSRWYGVLGVLNAVSRIPYLWYTGYIKVCSISLLEWAVATAGSVAITIAAGSVATAFGDCGHHR